MELSDCYLDDLFGKTTQESDPTADFLARERAALGDEFNVATSSSNTNNLGGFDKDFEQSASSFPSLDVVGHGDEGQDEFDAFTSTNTTQPNSSSFNTTTLDQDAMTAPSITSVVKGPYEGGMGSGQPSNNVSVTAHDDLGAFEQEYPAIDIPEPQQQQQQQQQTNGFSTQQRPQTSNYSQPSGAFSGVPQPQEEESEFIKNWKVKQKQDIAQREEESNKKKEEIIVKAQNSIDNFYKEYNSVKEKNIAKNKEEELEFNEKRTEELSKGTTWERICNLIELQDSRSKTTTKSKQDLTRFKEVLLGLKREGETAPGAAGY
ncbi:Clathrin light chain [Microbotryomycetes sp. JL221]|nr:Clathrin light chain [Microbotryomycetes sp. JL221]